MKLPCKYIVESKYLKKTLYNPIGNIIQLRGFCVNMEFFNFSLTYYFSLLLSSCPSFFFCSLINPFFSSFPPVSLRVLYPLLNSSSPPFLSASPPRCVSVESVCLLLETSAVSLLVQTPGRTDWINNNLLQPVISWRRKRGEAGEGVKKGGDEDRVRIQRERENEK